MSLHLSNKKLRNSIVTASQAWSAVYERQKLWREKTGRAEPFEGNEMTEWGNDHEHIALAAFEDEMNGICRAGNKLIVHPDRPLGASPDGYLGLIPVEIKCPFTQKIYPEIPERYYFQMQVQMFCVSAVAQQPIEACWFYIWTPNETSKEMVFYDESFMDWFIPKAEEFVQFVKDDVEPPRYSRKPIYKKEK
jgi:putative phage-type endonuclease